MRLARTAVGISTLTKFYKKVKTKHQKANTRAQEVALHVKALATQPEGLRSIPETCTTEGENRLPSNCPLTSTSMHPPPLTHSQK